MTEEEILKELIRFIRRWQFYGEPDERKLLTKKEM